MGTEAGNTTDTNALIKAAFNSAVKKVQDGLQKSQFLQNLEKDPRTKFALDDCKELTNLAISNLERSFNQLGELDFSKIDLILIKLRIWLSAVISYQESCLDGFQNTTGTAGDQMKQALNISMKISSNGLAMISEISSILSEFNIPGVGSRRRLLHELNLPILGHGDNTPEPEWFTPGVRRLLQATPNAVKPDIIVAKDGSAKFKTINEALRLIPLNSNKTFVLYIKAGVYAEHVQIGTNMTNILMIGDGSTKTRITGNKNFAGGFPFYKTATVAILGENFIAKNIGFENTAGPDGHQAVALKVQADMSIFYNCSMDGYQSTLFAHTHRQFYRDCIISGTIDIIFGDAAAVFQNCKLVILKPLITQEQCVVAAQGRKDRRETSALVLHNCSIVADPLYFPVRAQQPTFLARPWKEFSRTIVMESQLDDSISPLGWLPWLGSYGLDTCFFAEFNNRGLGSNTAKRVTWAGIQKLTPANASEFAPGKFIMGDSWIKPTGVPYTSGL